MYADVIGKNIIPLDGLAMELYLNTEFLLKYMINTHKYVSEKKQRLIEL